MTVLTLQGSPLYSYRVLSLLPPLLHRATSCLSCRQSSLIAIRLGATSLIKRCLVVRSVSRLMPSLLGADIRRSAQTALCLFSLPSILFSSLSPFFRSYLLTTYLSTSSGSLPRSSRTLRPSNPSRKARSLLRITPSQRISFDSDRWTV